MIFFTSDLHFNHTNVIDFCDRPFKNVEDIKRAKPKKIRFKFRNNITNLPKRLT